jgi:hypothetical protein
MSDKTTITATCLCKGVSFEIHILTSSLPLKARLCHCDICRHVSGTLCVFYAEVPELDWHPSILPRVVTYRSSANVERYFCGTCGSQMARHWRIADRRQEGWSVATAVMDKSEGIVEFVVHTYVGDTKDGGFSDWVTEMIPSGPSVKGKLKRWRTFPPCEEIPLDWAATPDRAKLPTDSKSEAEKGQKLYAHCHCKGVEFYISKPDVSGTGTLLPDEDPEIPQWIISQDKTRWMASNCVCRSCSLASGADVSQWMFLPLTHITLLDGSLYRPLAGTLTGYQSSNDVLRTFCGKCGASVGYHVDGRPQIVDIAVGLLDAESGSRAEDWLEWRTNKIGPPEDAHHKGLIDALVAGLKQWGERMHKS